MVTFHDWHSMTESYYCAIIVPIGIKWAASRASSWTGTLTETTSPLKMVHEVVFLLVLFGVASSRLPHSRICDPEPRRVTPTHCSNYNNLLHLDDIQSQLRQKQRMLQQKIDSMEGKTRLHLSDSIVWGKSRGEKTRDATEKQLRGEKSQAWKSGDRNRGCDHHPEQIKTGFLSVVLSVYFSLTNFFLCQLSPPSTCV